VRLWEARQNGFTIVGRCGGEDSKPWFERTVLMIFCVVVVLQSSLRFIKQVAKNDAFGKAIVAQSAIKHLLVLLPVRTSYISISQNSFYLWGLFRFFTGLSAR